MYKILVCILGLLSRLKLDIKTEGQRNLPTEGPVLIIFNHNDFLDTVVMLLEIQRKMAAFVAYEYRYNPAVILFNAAGSVILVRRGQSDQEALAKGLLHLSHGGVLTVAPEGTRGPSKKMGKGKYGPAFLAGKTGCPIVPVGINNTYNGFKWLFGSLLTNEKLSIAVTIGLPFFLTVDDNLLHADLDETGVKDAWQSVTNTQLMPKIAQLLPAEMHGEF
ncbi:1-acyl-sn-glycerol-3-phosphate acyltransferase [candidate division WWE3 bacterium]|jgi:1-acyl-sn-glycerol-3-phosphate acyltransferase|uniref:1-acyl-sn-glycerol-3-phosphate acyltransferase n=1 Tax=candidate division WWE3 bacterium TaxID=2053526 RepID=A0A3A4ZD95_UNCKA|nr:MAG: 1-acyl-sn-glycerol-3-phosphate acyltransferase [candidate division WWE3 bacterium]